ncbi:putative nucleic acid-binding protein, contains PIN domain [Candidatus Methanoperedens nitroreducens]|uniref:Putative nucleic acid-binding protein, contains PIN domain n=1 Tax=Candidatus Methanoperedens nitratireducens TaxID=1392998 RepID=A0A062UVE1_9EURY|nr:DUF3368 domain-containing protein [Candidatus Methanoperedens nitroreducens]KCZ70981.1 putative nucleic acid-binding protein, contains PIN domain [Candidatus Methanoperedens nitroreducens]MDJ1421649.1 DUF3368 domain-containing protein [Candidatus Methanoperedens sp.]
MEIADTTVISNFTLINRLDILANTIKLCTTEEVIEELKACAEKGILMFEFDVDIKIISMDDEERLAFLKLTEKFGRGEASCLAIGMHRKVSILTDDFDARRFAQRTGIPVSGTIGVLVNAVDRGIISKEEGNELLNRMIEKGFYSPFETLDQLLL